MKLLVKQSGQAIPRYPVFLALVSILGVFAGGCAQNLASLSLRDSRLPLEARRWLADAEDEVSIASAQLEDAKINSDNLQRWLEPMLDRVEDDWPESKAAAAGETAAKNFEIYVEKRLLLAQNNVDAAQLALELANQRLRLIRAETAVRYDIAIYETDIIIEKVREIQKEYGQAVRQKEIQQANVEKAMDILWASYQVFVKKGGTTDTLWFSTQFGKENQ